MKKKISIGLLTFVIAVAMLMPASAFAAVTTAATPVGTWNTHLKWRFITSGKPMDFTNAPTPPAVDGNYVYFVAGKKLYKLDKDTGKVLAGSTLPGTVGFGTSPVAVDSSHNVYVFVNGSCVVKYSSDLKKLATSKKFQGQNEGPLKIIGDRIYGGTWNDSTEGGTYFALKLSDLSLAWEQGQYDKEGYYWDGACEVGDSVVFGSDGGNLYIASKTGTTVTKVLNAGEGMTIRSTPVSDGSSVYVASKTATSMSMDSTGVGYLTKYKVSGTSLTEAGKVKISPSVNTPLISGDNLYIGSNGGNIYAIDKDKMEIAKTVKAPANVQGEMLISTGNSGKICIYSTYNRPPGGIYYIELTDDLRVSAQGETFIPPLQQYCISPVVSDADGNLYYKNDAGDIMAVGSGKSTSAVTGLKSAPKTTESVTLSWSPRENVRSFVIYQSTDKKTYRKVKTAKNSATSAAVESLKTGKTYYLRIRAELMDGSVTDNSSTLKVKALPPAPGSVKARAGSRKITVSWKKVSKASGYQVVRATSKSGKYKTAATLKKGSSVKYTNQKLKKGKTYYYKVRAYRTVSGKKIYGAYSGIVYKKVK
ncbi:PQQ-binding-like beta-propeller repeat protein [Hornefia butyriciproducens]|uniref:fibronectin type III domain-containing protein n=1 Tax=Hornefia butyriciproducens TaxID=2652293 RepID=UPI0023F3D3CC|nr:fibronectin type III domain-containing protein [Hornefia butyriciproducens]MDD6300071.1 fibronectin type III domain-containing protein [Hornefia butyriciproducens]